MLLQFIVLSSKSSLKASLEKFFFFLINNLEKIHIHSLVKDPYGVLPINHYYFTTQNYFVLIFLYCLDRFWPQEERELRNSAPLQRGMVPNQFCYPLGLIILV